MSALSPSSEVILRNQALFTTGTILFAGDLQDALPTHFHPHTSVCSSYYHQWQRLSPLLPAKAHFGLFPSIEQLQTCDQLIYFWPKSKQEARLQLSFLLANLSNKTEFFIVGENRSGVKSVEKIITLPNQSHKIDTARRCSLYHIKLVQPILFDFDSWWHYYTFKGVKIATLPGVFSQDKLDVGSQLLLDSLPPLAGSLLDIGCGAGVLATYLAKTMPSIHSLTLTDVYAGALEASRITLASNQVAGAVIASDMFSELSNQRFDVIISNPPFHDGRHTNYQATHTLIQQAPHYLNSAGRFYLVANTFLPYPEWLNHAFGGYSVLVKTAKFKVYQAIKQ